MAATESETNYSSTLNDSNRNTQHFAEHQLSLPEVIPIENSYHQSYPELVDQPEQDTKDGNSVVFADKDDGSRVPKRTRRRVWILIIIALLLVLIGLGIGLGIGLHKTHQSRYSYDADGCEQKLRQASAYLS